MLQILYLDADNLPLLDPGLMFDWQPFQESGCLFWPDYMGADLKEVVAPPDSWLEVWDGGHSNSIRSMHAHIRSNSTL